MQKQMAIEIPPAKLAAAQKAIAEGRIDPGLARYDRMRRGIDRAVKALGIDTEGPGAADARADARDQLDSFETIEGRAPNGEDIDRIVAQETERSRPDVSSVPTVEPDAQLETPQGLPPTDEAIFDDVKPQIIKALAEAASNGTRDTHAFSQVVRRTVGRAHGSGFERAHQTGIGRWVA